MVGTLLLRGMLVGFLAGVLCFGFLKLAGEPAVDRAIAFETQMDEAKDHAEAASHAAHNHDHGHDHDHAAAKDEPEPELVSRSVQAGIGLFTGLAVYSAAFGGLFALAFAVVYGRLGQASPRVTSALLAGAAFVSIYLVPTLKYPANPPAVGLGETIGTRTALYFAMICISLAAMIGCALLRRALLSRFGAWDAFLIAAAVYISIVLCAGFALPGINEVPAQFPAVVLWQFRVAALGAQALMWMAIGLVFGSLTARANAVSE